LVGPLGVERGDLRRHYEYGQSYPDAGTLAVSRSRRGAERAWLPCHAVAYPSATTSGTAPGVSIELDEAQRRVADHLQGGLLVLAPVGSGKTCALTERIGRSLACGQFRPERLLTLTFTNRAAHEVEQRLADRFPEQVGRLWISTFHGLCATILRREAR